MNRFSFYESNQFRIKYESFFFFCLCESIANGFENQMRIDFLFVNRINNNMNRFSFCESNQFRIKYESIFFCDSNKRCTKWPYKLIRWSYKSNQIRIKWSFFFFFRWIESNANWALFGESNQLWIKCESIFFLRIESNANRFFKSNQFQIKCGTSFFFVNQMRLEFFFVIRTNAALNDHTN
jgi:hypothetical protein